MNRIIHSQGRHSQTLTCSLHLLLITPDCSGAIGVTGVDVVAFSRGVAGVAGMDPGEAT